MRRLLTFACQSEVLAATLDLAAGTDGLLLVTGGSQTRIGSHRMYERLSKSLAANGFSCFRFDRRGVGDSSGEDPDYLGSAADIASAAAAFRAEAPQISRLFGFGLCDGAAALALFGAEAGLDGIVMVNPWLVEAVADAPPPAAISDHYRRRLLSVEGWKKLLTGRADYRKILKGVGKLLSRRADSSLAADVATALKRTRLPAQVILAEGDATAVAAAAELRNARFDGRIAFIHQIASDSHTFARPGDEDALANAVLDALRRLAA